GPLGNNALIELGNIDRREHAVKDLAGLLLGIAIEHAEAVAQAVDRKSAVESRLTSPSQRLPAAWARQDTGQRMPTCNAAHARSFALSSRWELVVEALPRGTADVCQPVIDVCRWLELIEHVR